MRHASSVYVLVDLFLREKDNDAIICEFTKEGARCFHFPPCPPSDPSDYSLGVTATMQTGKAAAHILGTTM